MHCTLHIREVPSKSKKCMMMIERSLTFVVVASVPDPIAIEVIAGDEIPRATNAFTAVFPPTLADRSKVRLDVASMMVMIVVVELFGRYYGKGSMIASSVEKLWLLCWQSFGLVVNGAGLSGEEVSVIANFSLCCSLRERISSSTSCQDENSSFPQELALLGHPF